MIRNINDVKATGLDSSIALLQFLNCDIKVPTRYGGEVIASGCGSGKTTVIKDIIRQKFNEGILYSAATIEECNNMYSWCISELVDKGAIANNVAINENDIIVLHSKDGEGMNTFTNSPEDIASKLIVICTHHKLLHEYPDILLNKNFDIRSYAMQTGTRLRGSVTRKNIGNGSYILPRQWVLIDEMPTCDISRSRFTKPVTAALMREVDNSIVQFNPNSNQMELVKYDVHYDRYPTYQMMETSYNMKIKGTNLDIVKGDKPIDQLRSRLHMETFYENFSVYNPTSEIKDINVKYNLTDLILTGLDTRFWIFDGTGDLTFDGGTKFNVRKVNNKYSSNITLYKIPIHIERGVTERFVLNKNAELIEKLDKNVDELINIILQNNKTLIEVWKDLKIKYGNKEKSTVQLTVNSINSDFSLPEYYTIRICNKLNIPVTYNSNGRINTLGLKYMDKEFSFIHYQSGLDKATNQFRDYDTVVLFGKFMVPNSAIDEFNEIYECNTTHMKYTTYQLVQAICRTRIRKHDGSDIQIYFTEDWDENYIMYLNMYLTNNPYWTSTDKNDPNMRFKLLNGGSGKIIDNSYSFIKSDKWRPTVKLLCEFDQQFKSAVLTGSGYTLKLTLDEIYKLIPMKVKEVRKYTPLVNYLKTLGIELVVESTLGTNQYTK